MGQLSFGHRSPPATETPIASPITNPFNQYAYGANDTLITDYPLAKVGTCRFASATVSAVLWSHMHVQHQIQAVLICSHGPARQSRLIMRTLLNIRDVADS